MKQIILKKGYTLEVVSWENDGDDYNTIRLTVDSKEKAIALRDLCNLSSRESCHNGGLGNLNNSTEEYDKLMVDFIKEHPILKFEKNEYKTQNEFLDTFMNWNFKLFGSSEWYVSRVCESVKVFYSEEDIYAETIE